MSSKCWKYWSPTGNVCHAIMIFTIVGDGMNERNFLKTHILLLIYLPFFLHQTPGTISGSIRTFWYEGFTKDKTCNAGISAKNGSESTKLKIFITRDVQGPVFDDAGAFEMLSKRSIILEGRAGKRFHQKEDMQRGYFSQRRGRRHKTWKLNHSTGKCPFSIILAPLKCSRRDPSF